MNYQRRLAAGLIVSALIGSTAFGRQPPGPSGNPPPQGPYLRTPPVGQPTSGTQADGGVAASLLRTPVNNPAPAYPPDYSPYGIPYIESPAHGYLSGVAEVTTANGAYLSQVQQARLLQSQADMSKLDLRVRMAEQQRYLKSLEPTYEETRQKDIYNAINRSRNTPPTYEIWSGKALDAMLVAIQREQRDGRKGPIVPLDPVMLAHINLTTGTTSAGVGMLKELKRFQWPLPLLDDAFTANRNRIESLARQAVEQAPSGAVDPRISRELQKLINGMISTVKQKVDDYSPTDYVQMMRYLREISDSTKVLQDANVSNYFNDTYRATGNTVDEMIDGMTRRGLTFAPASTGDEPYYTALHKALVNYDYGLHRVAAR
jgi:hypothetical protein